MNGRNEGPIAVIADVHGNRWALEAVLEDVERRGVCGRLLNLGDSLYGPLDPAGTAELLLRLDAVHIRGNQDRVLLEPPASLLASPTYRFVVEQLEPRHVELLERHRTPPQQLDGLLLCHGTPTRDDAYLLERVGTRGVEPRDAAAIAAELGDTGAELVLCGHSHVPRVVSLADGRVIANPGSVGLPAYTDDEPHPHAMESGSPHARYAVIERAASGWRVEPLARAYDWEAAARAAEGNGRADWARWIRTGRGGG